MNNNETIKNEVLELLIKSMPPRFAGLTPNFDYYNQIKDTKQGLLILGNVGTGKTRLLLEIMLAELIDTFEYIKTVNFDEVFYDKNPASYTNKVMRLFRSVPDTLRTIKEEFDNPSKHSTVEIMMQQPILYLDDLGTEKATDWVKEQLYLVLNDRYNWMKPIVITSNLTLKEIAECYSERFASRLVEMCQTVKLTGEDRRTAK